MIWAKIESNKVVGVCTNAPPASEAGEMEAGWEERSPDDPAVLAYYQAQASQPSAPQSNMLNFRLGMLGNPGYQRITAAIAASPARILIITRLETAISLESPHWPAIQLLWGQIIGALPAIARPTATEIAAWNAICQQCDVKAIAFDAQGRIVVN